MSSEDIIASLIHFSSEIRTPQPTKEGSVRFATAEMDEYGMNSWPSRTKHKSGNECGETWGSR